MDPDHVTGKMVIIGSNRESIYCLLHLRLLYYSVLSLFVQYWSILQCQYTVYTVVILGYSSVPVLSNIAPSYWATLIDQDFIISPLFSMALSFVLVLSTGPMFCNLLL